MDILNYPVWGGANRERVFRKMEETFKGLENNRNFYSIERVRRNQQPYIKELRTYLEKELQSRTDAYYEEQYLAQFGKAYRKTDADLEMERKAEEQAGRERERRYEEAVWENRSKIDAAFPLSEKEFLNAAEECGWLGTYNYDDRDLTGLGTLYNVTRNSGNERLQGLLNKILITDVTTKKNRDAFVKEIQDTVSDVLAGGTIFGKDAEKLKKICDGEGILPDVSAKEIERTRKRYENKQNRDGNLEEFHRIMLRQNWDEEDFPFFDSLYDFQTKRVDQKGSSPIDKELEEFMKKKVGYFNPAIDKNAILRKFKDAVGRSSMKEDDRLELEDMIDKKISQGLKEETREKEIKSFNNAEVAIAQDYDYDPKTYHADAEFRNEEKADKDREKAETLEIKKVLLGGKTRLDVKKHYADAEFQDENNADRDPEAAEDEKNEGKADEEQNEEQNKEQNEGKADDERKSDVPVVNEPEAGERKSDAPVPNVKIEEVSDEDQKDDAEREVDRKEEDQKEEDRKEEEKEEDQKEEEQDVERKDEEKEEDRESERSSAHPFINILLNNNNSKDNQINDPEDGKGDLEKTKEYVKNTYVFNFARISLMSAIDKELTKLSRAKQTDEIMDLQEVMENTKRVLNGNSNSMRQMYDAVNNMSAVAQNTKGYDGLRTQVMHSVISEAIRPLMDVSDVKIELSEKCTADVTVKELYGQVKEVMDKYGIGKPVKGSSRESYVEVEKRAKARFLLYDSLTKECGKPVLTSFIDSGMVNSLLKMGKPKNMHEFAKDHMAEVFLKQAGSADASTDSIKELTAMVKNKDFAKLVDSLERNRPIRGNGAKMNNLLNQARQKDSVKKPIMLH